jgi:hypothetical protein
MSSASRSLGSGSSPTGPSWPAGSWSPTACADGAGARDRLRKRDPLYAARRTLHTGADLLTEKQKQRLEDLFADDADVAVKATWAVYQRMIAAYRQPRPPEAGNCYSP